jgi:hypothetical protein
MSDPEDDRGDEIADLRRRMAEAAAADDFETAARLRDQLGVLTGLRRQVPGRMGLGTDQAVYKPPEGWTPPKRPDPMTSGHKPGGRKRR